MTPKASPRISIIIPVYNSELYLRDCLDSVVNQSLREIEIICVNDGSVDSSLVILHEYAKRDDRIKIIDKPNEGQSVARNLALSIASGKYVVFVDSDDHVDPNLCLKTFDIAEEQQCDVIVYDHFAFRKTSEIPLKSKKPSLLTVTSVSDKEQILKGIGVVWTKLIRNDFIRTNHIMFPNGMIYEDIFVHWQVVTLAKTIAVLPEKLYHYRIQPYATTMRTDLKILDKIVVLDLVRDFLVSQNFYETYRDLLIRSQLESFYNVYDYIDSIYKDKVMTLIGDSLRTEHWEYIKSQKPLTWRTRTFYQANHGSILAKICQKVWLFARSCYRFFKKRIA